jgi:predicted SAM-dependent methyltransferase
MASPDIKKINRGLLEKVGVAQPILNRIKSNPQLAHVHDSNLLFNGDSRWNQHVVMDTFNEIVKSYDADCYNSIIENKEIPGAIKTFFNEAYNYRFRGSI